MPAPAQAISLLVVTSQANEAERLITSLRNGGLPVRGVYSANAARIVELVERRACDLILCCAYAPEVDLATVQARHRELDADVPLIVIADHHSEPQAMIEALRGGARDVTERDDHEHLQLVVGREIADLRQRRQLRRISRRLQQCEQRGRELIEGAGEAVAFVQDGIHMHANPAYLALFRFPSLDELQAATFLDLIFAKQRQQVRDFLREREAGQPTVATDFPITCVRADTSRFAATLFAMASELDSEACVRVTVREIAATDSVGPIAAPGSLLALDATPTCDYDTVVAVIQARIGPERHPARPFALFYIHAPTVAAVLRAHGLSRGHSLLAGLMLRISAIGGSNGTALPIGDQGFCLLVDDADEDMAKALATRIRSEASLAQAWDSPTNKPDCEVGYVLVSGPSRAAMDLLDEAFQRSFGPHKAIGEPSRPTKPTSLAARTKQTSEDGDDETAAKVEYALANERFLLVYQPIISLMGDNQENYSVLLRLIDAQDNLLEAGDFIGAAIRLGMIERIDKWAIRQAIQSVGQHRSTGHNLNFFINLAEDSFRDPGVIIWICNCLREFDVRGNWVTFVFQEELVESNLGSLTKLIEGLKKVKCRVAVNRFGGSQRPQALLQALPWDFVLFQPDFAAELADDKDKQQRLLSLANLAREYNIKSVVTGVEDARALTILWTAGVDYVQGNFLQRPSPTLETNG